MSDPTTFGAWLRQWRKRRDLTQAALAALAGCALGTLRNIEADAALPSKQLAARLARALGVAHADIAAAVAFARGAGEAPAPPLVAPPIPAAHPQTPHVSLAPLPAQLTKLIGRMEEVDAACKLLLREDVRLVTLTGTGGTGKTRVALASAPLMADAFPDGIAFVDLATISDSSLVLTTIAQTVGVALGGEQPIGVQLAAALRDRALLLLLDNFEQVIAAASALVTLLLACSGLKALVTSRVTLGVTGEYELPVPPLALPARVPLPPFEQLAQYEAVRLFDERSRAASPRFAITAGNALAVAEICHRLDGLPLAIELVSTWVKVFEPPALLHRLEDRLPLLTGGSGRPIRQQTMWNTIAWSERLLAPEEQRLLQRFSVFAGGATLSAIEFVCGDGDEGSALVESVTTLVNHSLLRPLAAATGLPGDEAADPRLGMLETIRQYASAKLSEQPERAMIQRSHATYYLTLAEHAMAQWGVANTAAAIAHLKRELNNIRAALQWARDGGDTVVGLRLAGVLWRFWRTEGFISEGRAWLEQLLVRDASAPNGGPVAAGAARLLAVVAAAWLACDQHDYDQAERLLAQSTVWRQAVGETEHEARQLHTAALQARALETHLLQTAGLGARAAGEYRRATTLFEDALARGRALHAAGVGHALYDMGFSLYGLALLLREQGDFARAELLFEECVTFHREAGDREGVAQGLLGLGDVARDQGDAARLRTYTESSLAIYREFGTQWAIGFGLHNLAQAAFLTGDLDQAHKLVGESVAMFRAQNADGSLAEVLVTVGHIARAQGKLVAAYAASLEALRLAQVVGPRLLVANALEGLAGVVLTGDQAQLAVQLLGVATRLRAQMSTPVRPVDKAAVDQALATTRSILGPDTFAATWQVAQALALEDLLDTIPAAI